MIGWIEAHPTTRETADTVADFLLNHIIPRFRLPSSIQSDNGPGFTSQIIQQVSTSLGITWKLQIPYHPQSSDSYRKESTKPPGLPSTRCCFRPEPTRPPLPNQKQLTSSPSTLRPRTAGSSQNL
ncbi:uncharacterized protein [Desmodus rotundus]|uniref:uncharacterized protein isoform X2 n=1 Tax=Desmodus rotundus TaxID=9430 RepID=UPI0039E2436C